MGEAREYLIRKDGYFYRPNSRGYTTSKFEAGRYTKADAEAEAAVEPWHMSAVHQDDVPDDAPSRSIKDKDAEIEKLLREIHEARQQRDAIRHDFSDCGQERSYLLVKVAEMREALRRAKSDLLELVESDVHLAPAIERIDVALSDGGAHG